MKLVQNIVFKAESGVRPFKNLFYKKKGCAIQKRYGQVEEENCQEFVLTEQLYPSNFGGSSSIIMLTFQLHVSCLAV